jgi:hypothetical protein
LNRSEKIQLENIAKLSLGRRPMANTKRQSAPMLLINNVSQSDQPKNNLYRIQLLKTVRKLDLGVRKTENYTTL